MLLCNFTSEDDFFSKTVLSPFTPWDRQHSVKAVWTVARQQKESLWTLGTGWFLHQAFALKDHKIFCSKVLKASQGICEDLNSFIEIRGHAVCSSHLHVKRSSSQRAPLF